MSAATAQHSFAVIVQPDGDLSHLLMGGDLGGVYQCKRCGMLGPSKETGTTYCTVCKLCKTCTSKMSCGQVPCMGLEKRIESVLGRG
jgi:hypothetical protein